jgi:mono/diheme cytochrome c family protein
VGLVGLLSAACGGLAGEPEIVATIPPATVTPSDRGFPESLPDLALGAQIYAERCTECHGSGGRGDGNLVVDGQVAFPGDFTDPATMRDQTPDRWFQTISNGRIENLMPPWRGALTEEQRWAVALYTYTLPYTTEQLALGGEIWDAECSECHGATGAGDGERAEEVGRIPKLNDPVEIVFASDAEYFDAITIGADEQMPAYEETHTEAERWAAVAYARSLALDNVDVIGTQPDDPASTPEADGAAVAAAVSEGAITGQVVNGTSGGSLPDALTVTLYLLEETATGIRNETVDTMIDADGNFAFADVPLDPNRGYILSTLYRDRIFASDLITGSDIIDAPEIPLTIYDLTEDPTVINIASVEIQADAIGEGLQILQEVVFRNESDRLYTNSLEIGSGRFASVVVNLPPGAVGVGFPGSTDRFVFVEEQGSIVDTIPVVPGEDHRVLFSYFLPYEFDAIIEQQVLFNLDGAVRLRLFPDSIEITSEQITRQEPQTMEGRAYQVYSGDVTLETGDLLRYDLSGAARTVSTPIEPATASGNATIILLAGLVVLVTIAGVMFYIYLKRGSSRLNRQTLIDGLVSQIAELDADFEAGDLEEANYRSQRDQLKARLTALMKPQEE